MQSPYQKLVHSIFLQHSENENIPHFLSLQSLHVPKPFGYFLQ